MSAPVSKANRSYDSLSFRDSATPGASRRPAVSLPPTSPDPPPACEHLRWFAEEVQPHDGQLKAYLRGSFPTVRDVDDVVQESYLRIWRARAAHPIESARAFLFQVARRLALDFVRRERVSPVHHVSDVADFPVLDPRGDVIAAVSRQEKIRLLAAAIDALPRRCREIFILRRLKCIPQKEVAARLGLSERTIEVQVLRGLQRCEAFLRERGVRDFFGDETQ